MQATTVVTLAALTFLPLIARATESFTFFFAFGACGCGTQQIGAWSGATDGYDPEFDLLLLNWGGLGYAGVYHDKTVEDGWGGPTGFYRTDLRGLPAPGGSFTIAPIHVWADPIYSEDMMSFALAPNTVHVPPANRRYRLTLTYVPPEVVGAPPVGFSWALSPTKEFKVDLPVYRTHDGTRSYRFAFSVSPEVPPCDEQLPGDANCDGVVTPDDVDLFVAALAGETAWRDVFGGPVACGYLCVNDLNGDGTVDFTDIDGFLAALAGAGP